MAYVGSVLRVDLTDGSLRQEPLDEAFSRAYIGGRGFTSRLQYDLIPRDVDPLGPDNVLIIAPGALTGTSAPSASRFVVAARSPLTGILGDANSGGFVGAVLKRAGYSLALIRGRSPQPVYLCIDDAAEERVRLCDARHLWGRDVHETTDSIKQEHGRGFCVAAIGPAGENRVRIAAVMADKEHAAGRTGLGAVMGSKNLKAIAVRSRQDFPYRNEAAFKALVTELLEIEQNDRRAQDFSARGTLGTLMDHHSAIGAMNTRNFQFGQFEGKEKVDHEALAAEYLVRPTGCYRCSLKCDRYSRVEEGEFAGVEVAGPEYSTAVALGPALGIDNMAAILKGNDLANRYGLDTIDLGGVIAFAMELYQRGILSQEEADGLDLEWGNYHTMLELVRRIAFREGPFADLLAHGVHVAAQKIGRGAERYAVHVKGMTPAPLDARPVKVYNFRYAVSPRGADHLRISAPGAYALDSMPLLEAADKLRYWESVVAIPDLMGVCKFAYTYYTETPDVALHRTLDIIPDLYTAATGLTLTRDKLLETAARVVNVERAHNCRLGLTANDDTLPPRFTEDPMPEGPAKGKVYDILEPMKEAWYTVQGWDPGTGIPKREMLEKLGLGDIADDLDLWGLGDPKGLEKERKMTQLIDLSMEVSADMVVFPRVARPIIAMLESWEEFATNIGAAEYGATWLTAHYVVVLGDHVGTHVDSLKHMRADAPGADGIPLEYCYGDGVVLDFSDRPVGYGITAEDCRQELARIGYTLKPLDIVLIKTGAGCYNTEMRYLTDHCGMTGESTEWLIDQGIKMVGIDAPTWDRPVQSMFETKEFWPGHVVMLEREYYHLENLANLDAIPTPHGFKVAVFPIKWIGTTAAPVRAVAILEE